MSTSNKFYKVGSQRNYEKGKSFRCSKWNAADTYFGADDSFYQDFVVGEDLNIYLCLKTNTGYNPINDTTHWLLALKSLPGKTFIPRVDSNGNLSWELVTDITQSPSSQNIKGPKGDTGEIGPQGEQGIQGPRGLKGETGEKGDKGDTGAQGEKGDKGDRGATGARGERGERGLKGDRGERGPKGEKGDSGLRGLPGVDGKDGSKVIFGREDLSYNPNFCVTEAVDGDYYINIDTGYVYRLKKSWKWIGSLNSGASLYEGYQVLTIEQNLTDEEKLQVQKNIGLSDSGVIKEYVDSKLSWIDF